MDETHVSVVGIINDGPRGVRLEVRLWVPPQQEAAFLEDTTARDMVPFLMAEAALRVAAKVPQFISVRDAMPGVRRGIKEYGQPRESALARKELGHEDRL